MRLSAFFFTALALLLIHMSSHAHAATKLDNCSIPGSAGISTPFVNCINRNFSSIKRATGLDVANCFNTSDGLSFTFQVCANRNFRHVSQRLNLSLISCPNLGEEVTTMYVSCIRKSFDTIERSL
jgi:hypothetical protein